MKSGFDQGSRWGIKGTEDLGNGYSVGFILEQGYDSDNGNAADSSKQFRRESILNVKGGFGSLAFGRTGGLASGAQSQQILTGWALRTGFGLSAWNAQTAGTLRADNAISYATPVFNGFSVHAMYSNGITGDSEKWSENAHYYGLGVKYQQAAIRSSLIFEYFDNKGTETAAKTAGSLFSQDEWAIAVEGIEAGTKLTDAQKEDYKKWAKTELEAAKDKKGELYVINYGLEYNLGSWTPMFAYQFYHQDEGLQAHKFGLSANVDIAGGQAKLGAAYIFGKDDGVAAGKEDDVRSWNIGAAYIYPLTKRTALKAYAGYADSSKSWKDAEEVAKNGYQVYFGLRHSF